ncbi:MAG: DNA polymerase III subunit delta' [Clostridiales bacterium]|nr:MAG: DNA polymerase III subunit delta' [Clostridiales bacterium]
MMFDQIIGNGNTVRTLQNAASGGPLNHAYLLHGTKGTGKRMLARIFAQAILCRGENRPCKTCSACLKVEKGVHPDLVMVQKPEGKANILVDQVRSLREQVYIRPNESEYRVVIIEESESMNLSAANALLKVLEEPPGYVVFILTANNISALPETIASRCLCLEMQEVSLYQAEKWLISHYPDGEAAILEDALSYGNGNLGRSIAYMEEETCRQGFDRALTVARSLTTEREYDILEALSPFDGDKDGFLQLLTDLDAMMAQVAIAGTGSTNLRQAAALSQKIRPMQAVHIHELTDEIRSKILYNGNGTLMQNLFCARLKTIMER